MLLSLVFASTTKYGSVLAVPRLRRPRPTGLSTGKKLLLVTAPKVDLAPVTRRRRLRKSARDYRALANVAFSNRSA
jgi:hypothetical protein